MEILLDALAQAGISRHARAGQDERGVSTHNRIGGLLEVASTNAVG